MKHIISSNVAAKCLTLPVQSSLLGTLWCNNYQSEQLWRYISHYIK